MSPWMVFGIPSTWSQSEPLTVFANQQGSLSCEWFENLSEGHGAMQNSRRFCFYNPVALSSRKLKSRSSGNQIPHLSYLYLSFRALFMILITCSKCMVDCISNDYWAGKPSRLSLNENNAGVLWKSAAWAMNIDEVRSVKIDLAPTIKRHHITQRAKLTSLSTDSNSAAAIACTKHDM